MLPQIILINETWLDEAMVISGYIADNYCIFCKDRNKNGGGVLALALKFLNPVHVQTYNANVEAVWFEFNVGIEKLLIGTVYRPPNCNMNEHNIIFCLKLLDSVIHILIIIFACIEILTYLKLIGAYHVHSITNKKLLVLLNALIIML